MTNFQRVKTWLCMIGIVAAAAAAFDDVVRAAESLRVVPLIPGNQVLVTFELADGYTDDVRDAIASGLRTTFRYQVELRTVARLWLDRAIATVVVDTSDRYDNLTRRHTLMRTVDGRVEASEVTEDQDKVRKWLTSMDRFAVCETSKLDLNREYYVRISVSVLPNRTSAYGWASPVIGQRKFTFIR